jgi:hypothetical protein
MIRCSHGADKETRGIHCLLLMLAAVGQDNARMCSWQWTSFFLALRRGVASLFAPASVFRRYCCAVTHQHAPRGPSRKTSREELLMGARGRRDENGHRNSSNPRRSDVDLAHMESRVDFAPEVGIENSTCWLRTDVTLASELNFSAGARGYVDFIPDLRVCVIGITLGRFEFVQSVHNAGTWALII